MDEIAWVKGEPPTFAIVRNPSSKDTSHYFYFPIQAGTNPIGDFEPVRWIKTKRLLLSRIHYHGLVIWLVESDTIRYAGLDLPVVELVKGPHTPYAALSHNHVKVKRVHGAPKLGWLKGFAYTSAKWSFEFNVWRGLPSQGNYSRYTDVILQEEGRMGVPSPKLFDNNYIGTKVVEVIVVGEMTGVTAFIQELETQGSGVISGPAIIAYLQCNQPSHLSPVTTGTSSTRCYSAAWFGPGPASFPCTLPPAFPAPHSPAF